MSAFKYKPWETIALSADEERRLYRDWGNYFSHKQQYDRANRYYDKSLALKSDDPRTLYYRCRCKRHIAQIEGALKDANAASTLCPENAPINLEICDALYQLNQFEDNKIAAHNSTRMFSGKKLQGFRERIAVVNQNFEDSIGDPLAPFILKRGAIFQEVLHVIDEKTNLDKRPLWKILQELGNCDVLSYIEKKDVLLSPLETARRERAFKVFNQLYMNRSWVDVCFLRSLRNNKMLQLPQSKILNARLQNVVHSKYAVVKKYTKMLHSRSPMYSEFYRNCPDKRIADLHQDAFIKRLQYQTRRNMMTILRSVRILRRNGEVNKLARYVEAVMGDYVVMKTNRIMPWKFEFMNEIYNCLALAYADRFLGVPFGSHSPMGKQRLMKMLRMPSDKLKDRNVDFVFGDRSTFQQPDAVDFAQVAYRKFVSRLEKRMRFSNHGIERCYLLHEIARAHLRQNRVDECCSIARRAIDEARANNHRLWRFLSTMLIVKAHAVLHKVERGSEALDEAMEVATELKCPELISFVELCRIVNSQDLALKKRTQSMDSLRRRSRSSRMSLTSQSFRSSGNSYDDGEEEEEDENESATSRSRKNSSDEGNK